MLANRDKDTIPEFRSAPDRCRKDIAVANVGKIERPDQMSQSRG